MCLKPRLLLVLLSAPARWKQTFQFLPRPREHNPRPLPRYVPCSLLQNRVCYTTFLSRKVSHIVQWNTVSITICMLRKVHNMLLYVYVVAVFVMKHGRWSRHRTTRKEALDRPVWRQILARPGHGPHLTFLLMLLLLLSSETSMPPSSGLLRTFDSFHST